MDDHDWFGEVVEAVFPGLTYDVGDVRHLGDASGFMIGIVFRPTALVLDPAPTTERLKVAIRAYYANLAFAHAEVRSELVAPGLVQWSLGLVIVRPESLAHLN